VFAYDDAILFSQLWHDLVSAKIEIARASQANPSPKKTLFRCNGVDNDDFLHQANVLNEY